MIHGSLFSGIGGFDLAAEWAGWENKFHCEWNEFGQRVLRYYWPNAKSYGDITKTDFTIWRGRIDVLTGGFPCQPYSLAGKRLGKEDERHLWPEMLRVIREVQPKYVVGENVPGLVNWNGGMVFDEVQADLEDSGYEVIPFILPAASVNAPHRRDRVWFVAFKNSNKIRWRSNVRKISPCKRKFRNISTGNNERIRANNEKIGIIAHSDMFRCERSDIQHEVNASERRFDAQRNIEQNFNDGVNSDTTSQQGERFGFEHRKGSQQEQRQSGGNCCRMDNIRVTAYTSNTGLQGSKDYGSIGGIRTESNEQPSRFIRTDWENFPTQSTVCNGDDGLSSRLDGITFSKWRNEAVKACGNAIVPQVVFQIFKAINEYEKTH